MEIAANKIPLDETSSSKKKVGETEATSNKATSTVDGGGYLESFKFLINNITRRACYTGLPLFYGGT